MMQKVNQLKTQKKLQKGINQAQKVIIIINYVVIFVYLAILKKICKHYQKRNLWDYLVELKEEQESK